MRKYFVQNLAFIFSNGVTTGASSIGMVSLIFPSPN